MRTMLFEGARMLDCPDVPEIHCHGTRRIEVRPDGRICVWQCEDYLMDGASVPMFCAPRVKLILPIQTFIRNTQAIAQWAASNGLLGTLMSGPGALLPPFGTMH